MYASQQEPRHVPWPGLELGSFHSAGRCPTNWATPVKAKNFFNMLVNSMKLRKKWWTWKQVISCYQAEIPRKKRMKNKKSIEELSINVKWSNIFIIGFLEGEERAEKNIWRSNEKFHKVMKYIKPRLQTGQRSASDSYRREEKTLFTPYLNCWPPPQKRESGNIEGTQRHNTYYI